ncbi:hypothetical protein AEM51_00750 [Bacteroidetes bacterium UKL13-3]|nr:hypothetical protein AEM51_00750 [Bacteroidetes bacterium UKL13-3]HCP93515.1 hypothetical protein [Bacteroidota bacterium]
MKHFLNKTILSLAILLVVPFCLWAQKAREVRETGFYKMRIEKSISEAEAERICIERAKIDAIEKAFGQTVFQGNSTFVQNKNTGEKTETQNIFNSVSESLVNGEWLEDVKKPVIEKEITKEYTWISATVDGLIREIRSLPVTFKAYPMSCPNPSCGQLTFRDGQDLYMYFKAPQKGYVAIFADVPTEGKTYRLLPYKYSSSMSYSVEADKEYVFFYNRPGSSSSSEKVDDVTLFLSNKNTPEVTKIFVLYSSLGEFGKPLLSADRNKTETNKLAERNLETPLFLESEDFQRWLQSTRREGLQVQLYTTSITINP